MYLLVLAASALEVLLAQRDPTTICSPDRFKITFYDYSRNTSSRLVVDFKQNKAAVRPLQSTRNRTVYDYNTMRGYWIVRNQSCNSFDVDPTQVPFKCLPATATPINVWSVDGIQGTIGDDLLAYNIPITINSSIKMILTNADPAYPVYRELVGRNSPLTGTFLRYTNPKISETPSTLLEIPQSCPTA